MHLQEVSKFKFAIAVKKNSQTLFCAQVSPCPPLNNPVIFPQPRVPNLSQQNRPSPTKGRKKSELCKSRGVPCSKPSRQGEKTMRHKAANASRCPRRAFAMRPETPCDERSCALLPHFRPATSNDGSQCRLRGADVRPGIASMQVRVHSSR